jgi:hypothetical protein
MFPRSLFITTEGRGNILYPSWLLPSRLNRLTPRNYTLVSFWAVNRIIESGKVIAPGPLVAAGRTWPPALRGGKGGGEGGTRLSRADTFPGESSGPDGG